MMTPHDNCQPVDALRVRGGNRSLPVVPGWQIIACVSIGDGLSLAILHPRGGEAAAAWLLNNDGIILAVYGRARPSEFDGNTPELSDRLAPLRGRLRMLLCGQESVNGALSGIELIAREWPQICSMFINSLNLMDGARHVLKFFHLAAEMPKSCRAVGLREAFAQAVGNPLFLMPAAAAAQSSRSPGIEQLFGVVPPEISRSLPLDPAGDTALLTVEGGISCWRLGEGRPTRSTVYKGGYTYLPEQNLILHSCNKDIEMANKIAARLLDRLVVLLLKMGQGGRFNLRKLPKKISLIMTSGFPHVGHVLGEEMKFLIDAVKSQNGASPPMELLLVEGQTGLDIYDPLDFVFPELAGRIRRFSSMDDAVIHAIGAGSSLICGRAKGRYVPVELKRRMSSAAAWIAERDGLNDHLNELAEDAGVVLPFVGFGLRLMNRRPVDFLGFLVRLAQGIHRKIGPFVLVLDGLNEGPDGRAATNVYSAAPSLIKGRSDGVEELRREHVFVDALREGLAGLPIRIFSCIGLPIMQNIHCLSRCSFFVAPNGAGLSKFRWALDIPGFVLTSRFNLANCRTVKLYSDPIVMESPMAPLFYNTPEEVIDEDVGTEFVVSLKGSFVPYPHNFNFVDEKFMIEKIADLVKRYSRGSDVDPVLMD